MSTNFDDTQVAFSPILETLDTENTDAHDHPIEPPSEKKVHAGEANNPSRMDEFHAYCKRGKKDYKTFGAPMKAGIELMELMNKNGGSLTLYKAIFKWHVDNLEAQSTASTEKLHKTLIQPYNMEATLPKDVG